MDIDIGKLFFQGMGLLLGLLLVAFTMLTLTKYYVTNNSEIIKRPVTTSTTTDTRTDFARTTDGCVVSPTRLSNPVDLIFTDVRGGMVCNFMINSDLPTYTFELLPNIKQNILERLIIKEYTSDKAIQSMRIEMDSEPPAGLDIVATTDLNFDGYQDLKIVNSWSATGNVGYTVLLFNPTTHDFVKHDGLSNLTNPTIIPNTNTINSHSIGGMAGCVYVDQTYSIDTENNLMLLREEKQEWNNQTKSLTKSIKTLVDGNFKTSVGTSDCGT